MALALLRVDKLDQDPITLQRQFLLAAGLTLGRSNAAPSNAVSRKELSIESVASDEVLARIIGASPVWVARRGQPREAAWREVRAGSMFALRPGDRITFLPPQPDGRLRFAYDVVTVQDRAESADALNSESANRDRDGVMMASGSRSTARTRADTIVSTPATERVEPSSAAAGSRRHPSPRITMPVQSRPGAESHDIMVPVADAPASAPPATRPPGAAPIASAPAEACIGRGLQREPSKPTATASNVKGARASAPAAAAAPGCLALLPPHPPQRKLRRQRTAQADVAAAAVETGLQRQRTAPDSPLVSPPSGLGEGSAEAVRARQPAPALAAPALAAPALAPAASAALAARTASAASSSLLRRIQAAAPRGREWRDLAIVIHPSSVPSSTTLSIWRRRLPALGADVYTDPPAADVIAGSSGSARAILHSAGRSAAAGGDAMQEDRILESGTSGGAAFDADHWHADVDDQEVDRDGDDMRELSNITRGLSISQPDSPSPRPVNSKGTEAAAAATLAALRPGHPGGSESLTNPPQRQQLQQQPQQPEGYSTLSRIFGVKPPVTRPAAVPTAPAAAGAAPTARRSHVSAPVQRGLGTAQVLPRFLMKAGATAAAGGVRVSETATRMQRRSVPAPAAAAGAPSVRAEQKRRRLLVVVAGDSIMLEDLASWWSSAAPSSTGNAASSTVARQADATVNGLPFATNVRRLSLQAQLPHFTSLGSSEQVAALQRGFAEYHSPDWVFTGLASGSRPPPGAHPWIAHSRRDAEDRDGRRGRAQAVDGGSEPGSSAVESGDDDVASAGSSMTGRKRKRREAEAQLGAAAAAGGEVDAKLQEQISRDRDVSSAQTGAEPAAVYCLPLLSAARAPEGARMIGPLASSSSGSVSRWWQRVYACCDAPGRWGVDTKSMPPLACPFTEAEIRSAAASVMRQFPWLAIDTTSGRQFVDGPDSSSSGAGGTGGGRSGGGDSVSLGRAALGGAGTLGCAMHSSSLGVQDVCEAWPHNDYGVARPPSLNNHITGPLQTLRGVYDVIRDERSDLRLKMIDHAIGALAHATFRVDSVEDLTRLPVHLPPTMRAKIVETLATGHLAKAEEATATSHVRTLQLFDQVLWIGPQKGAFRVSSVRVCLRKPFFAATKRAPCVAIKMLALCYHDIPRHGGPVTCVFRAAEKLWSKGYRTLDDLRTRGQTDRDITHQIRVGLKYFDELSQRVPREESAFVEAIVCREAAAILPGSLCICGGSYR